MFFKTLIVFGGILLFYIAAIYSKPRNSQFTESTLAQQLQTVLDEGVNSQSIVGASAAVIIPKLGVWSGTSGFSDPAASDTMRPDMLLGIGSITKTFTAALTLQLFEEERLDLDDSIYHYLPKIPYIDSTITIRQLLNHTSGIFDIAESKALEDSNNSNPDRYWTSEEILEKFMEPPYFEPGSTWGYSNTNYIVLGKICEEVTNSKISVEFQDRFYNPFKLSNTFLAVEDTLKGLVAHSWVDIDNDEVLEDISNIPKTAGYSTAWAGGAILSTAENIARWTKYLFEEDILNRRTLDEMLDFHQLNNFIPYYTGCGLGVWELKFYDKELWGHGGGGLGYSALTIYSPSDSIIVTVLVNQNASVADIAANLLDAASNYTTGIKDNINKSLQFELKQNFPNPFNPTTSISFSIPRESYVCLKIFDCLGRELRTLVSENKKEGSYTVKFNASNLSTGVYFYQIKADNFISIKKMLFLK